MVLHNPNNWHWVDKNCIQWSREYFGEKLTGITAEDAEHSATISSVKSVEGDVDVCQRKGKVISLFDLVIEMEYTGKAGETEVSGRIKVPEVAYDTEKDEFQFTISINDSSAEKEPVKSLVRSKIVPQLREKLAQFGPDLIKTHGSDIQHSPAEVSAHQAAAASGPAGSVGSAGAASGSTAVGGKNVKGQETYNTVELTLKPTFTASAEQLYQAFLDPQLVGAWTRSPPKLEPTVGGSFELFGGNVSGKFKQLEKNKHIAQSWRLRDWKAGHYANLDFEFVQGVGETTLVVRWEGIPVGQEEVVESNFQNYYVRPIMMTFGYGLP